MKTYVGKKHVRSIVALCLFAGIGSTAGLSTATAQEQASGAMPPPNVLVIEREFLKPGNAGSVHEKSESAFVQAMSQANSQEHYIAMNSLSGRSRALFFLGYDSFAGWQKDNDAMQKNPTLAAAFDQAEEADGKLLQSFDTGVFVYQPDKSVGTPINVGQMRYVAITMIKMHPGHGEDWDALAQMHNSIFGKLPNAHSAVFAKAYGEDSGGTYIVITPMRSLAELDQRRADSKQAWAAVSADQKKKMEDLEASAFESIETNLFAFDPKMSYPSDTWKKADPEFWGQQ